MRGILKFLFVLREQTARLEALQKETGMEFVNLGKVVLQQVTAVMEIWIPVYLVLVA